MKATCLFFLLTGLSMPVSLTAQESRARVEVDQENLRKDPNGRILATVAQGSEYVVASERGDWVELELEGWIWGASVSGTSRDGYDLVVSADGGENLRARPNGNIVAKLREGFLLNRVEKQGSWVRVKRRGWVFKRSISLLGPSPASDASQVGQAVGAGSNGEPAEGGLPPILTTPLPLAVYASPDGDTVAVFQPGGQARALGRTGDWVQVRIDGWVYAPAVLDSALDLIDTGQLSPALLRSDPGRYKGALLRWRVQFISLRRAEPARTDLREGEPFLLARGPAGDPGYVYLAVPDELLAVAERLEPLSYVTVVGRVRSGRSALTGSPVIDVTEIEQPPPR